MRALSSLGQGREAWRPTDCPRHMQGVTSSIQRVVLGHTSGEERNRKQRSHLPVTFAFLPLCSPTKEESEIQREVAGPGLRHRGQQGCGAEGGRGEKPGGWSRSLWTLFWELTDPARARVASLDTPSSPPQTSVPSPEEWSIGKEVE